LNRWFVVHDLLSYKQHPNMIGNVVRKSGPPEPRFSKFSEIQKGDLVVYYATKDMVVVGIFEVVSDMEYLPNDPHWKEIMIYRIKRVELPPPGKCLDFKKLLSEPSVNFDMFPKKQKWGSYLQGRTCKLLTESDYFTIKEALSKKKHLKSIKEMRAPPKKSNP
jgi:predicted RNA-binding protein